MPFCCKHFSFNFFTLLLFSFFCAIVDLSQCGMETSFSCLLGLLPAYRRLLKVFRVAPLLVLELPENISARRLQSVLEYGLLCIRTFCLLSINDKKSAEDFKVSFIVVKQDSHFEKLKLKELDFYLLKEH